MPGLIFAALITIAALFIANPGLWNGFLIVIAVIIFSIIGIIAWMVWEASIKPARERAAEKRLASQKENDRLQNEAAIPERWREANFPTVQQFFSDLAIQYNNRLGTGRILRHPYLKDLGDTFAKLYNKEFPLDPPSPNSRLITKLADPKTAYQLTLTTFAEALYALTKNISPFCTEPQQKDPPSMFNVRVTLSDTIITEDGAANPNDVKWTWKPGQYHAFYEMVKPFLEKRIQFEKLGLFDWDDEPYFTMTEPYSFEYTTTTQYENAKERYRKARQKAIDDMPEYNRPFLNTPFFGLSNLLLPKHTVDIPLIIPAELWFSSTWVCAPQGKGKTNLLHNIIKDRRQHGTIILMDAKGELINPYLHEALVIEPSLTNPPPINPLDIGSSIHAVELLEYLFSALLSAPMTPKQSTLFSGVLTLLVTVPNATVETLRQVFQTGWKSFERYVQALPKREREFFTEGAFDSKGYTATKEEVLWRLQLLFRNPYMAAILEVPRTRLNMSTLMDSGRIIVINNNPDILGDLGAEFFGRFMLALVWNAVRARAHGGSKKPVFFFIDEAQTVISRDDNIPKLIHQCRSQNVALIFAHQELSYIKSEDVKNALGNCAIRFCAPDGETAILAPRFRTTPEFLAALPPYHFAACIRDKETVAVTVPELKMPTPQPRMKEPTQNFDLEWEITISPKMAREGGKVKVEHLSVTIPPNTTHGSTLRAKGHGAPKPDGTRGDLYLTVNVPSHPDQRAIGRGPEEIG